jgi:hypothetical protein
MELFLTIIIITLVVVLMGVGILGIFIPFLPDVVFILLGALVYGLYDKFEHVGGWTYVILVVLALLITLVDYLATLVGARKLGATKYGIIGGIIGGVLGFFGGNIFGTLIGFILGAVIGELLAGRDFKSSLKSGSGAILGILGGSLAKLIIAFVMIGIFILAIIL